MSIDASKLLNGLQGVSVPGAPTGHTVHSDGDTATIDTPPISGEADFDQILERCGFDPAVYEIDGSPKVKRWEAQTPDGVEWLSSFSIRARRKADPAERGNAVGELVERIHSHTPVKTGAGGSPLMLLSGDLQLGKGPDASGDGTPGVVDRFKRAVSRAKQEALSADTSSITIAFLGDCIEGQVSQGGRVVQDWDLNLTDQLRVLRHLVTHAVNELREVGLPLKVASVPGNHDMPGRIPFDSHAHDSFAIDSVRAVEEAFTLAGVDGISWEYPKRNELHMVVDVDDHKVGLAHGHAWKTGQHMNWWKGMSFGGDPIGEADYLVAGHRHTFAISSESLKTFIQVPALEAESTWFKQKTGMTGNPGAVLLRPGPDHRPDFLAVV